MECHITDGPESQEAYDELWEWIESAREEEMESEQVVASTAKCERHNWYYLTTHGCQHCHEEGKIAPMKELTGWTSDYYDLPKGAEGIQDLIEYKNMNFAVANIFKASYRLGDKPGTTELYDLDKIIWFAQREKARILKQQEDSA